MRDIETNPPVQPRSPRRPVMRPRRAPALAHRQPAPAEQARLAVTRLYADWAMI